MPSSLPRLLAGLLTLLGATALAGEGTLTGKVEAMPARFLSETVVYLRDVKGPPVEPKKIAVDQKGLRFSPHVSAVTVGDTLEFQNHDAVEHNVFTPDNEMYNLGMIKPGGASSYQYARPGVYTQLCSVHPEMLAYVFVGENPYHAVVDAKGAFRIEHVPAGTFTVAIWNSHLKAPDQSVTLADGKTVELSFSLKR